MRHNARQSDDNGDYRSAPEALNQVLQADIDKAQTTKWCLIHQSSASYPMPYANSRRLINRNDKWYETKRNSKVQSDGKIHINWSPLLILQCCMVSSGRKTTYTLLEKRSTPSSRCCSLCPTGWCLTDSVNLFKPSPLDLTAII